jgi:hypothetical protein
VEGVVRKSCAHHPPSGFSVLSNISVTPCACCCLFLLLRSALRGRNTRKADFCFVCLCCGNLTSVAFSLPPSLSFFSRYDHEAPESRPVPDLQSRLTPLQRVLLVRAIREDRALVAGSELVSSVLGPCFAEPPPPSMVKVWEDSKPRRPIICLLSPGKALRSFLALLSFSARDVFLFVFFFFCR